MAVLRFDGKTAQGRNLRSIVNALSALAAELGADHATIKTCVDGIETLIEELHDDHATFKTIVDQLRSAQLYNAFGNPGFAIDTNFDVKNATAVYYTNGGTLKTLAANTSFDTGTSKTITGSQWSAATLSVNSSGTGVVTWAASSYASEAAAIAALVAVPATNTPLGYVTVNAHASGFTAGTDALTTGTGGNVATATNYYNSINPNAVQIGSGAPATLTASKPSSYPATLAASTSIDTLGT